MRVYDEQTEPLLSYYRERSLLREVEGLGSIEDISMRLQEALVGS